MRHRDARASATAPRTRATSDGSSSGAQSSATAAEPLADASSTSAIRSVPETPSTMQWCTLEMRAQVPSASPSTIHVSHSNFWGAKPAIAGTLALARSAASAGLPTLLIEDISNPRGGPMQGGHVSHQIGLDVDVALDMRPRPPLNAAARDSIVIASLVRADRRGVWGAPPRPGRPALAAFGPRVDGPGFDTTDGRRSMGTSAVVSVPSGMPGQPSQAKYDPASGFSRIGMRT